MKITQSNINDVFKSKLRSSETLELLGYKEVKTFFVDNSGLGGDDEPALTRDQFTKELSKLLKQRGALHTWILSVGMFQVYVGCYVKGGEKRARVISSNTLEIKHKDHTAIRLHDTDIIKLYADKMIIDNGGWATRTTHRRLNQWLPDGYCARSKNFTTIIEHRSTGQVWEVTEPVTISL